MITSIEISTMMGCRIACHKYCPQELIMANYTGKKVMTIEDFSKILAKLPKGLPITFSGLCEPFQNPETKDMIILAYERGHPIDVYSTLKGLDMAMATELVDKVEFRYFKIHLPDAYGNANILIDNEYLRVLSFILQTVPNLDFMSMNGLFRTNDGENRMRGNDVQVKRGRVFCDRLESPNFMIMPNGWVYFCCMAKNAELIIGNIYEQTYEELVERHKYLSPKLQRDNESICHRCSWSYPKWLDYARWCTDKAGRNLEWLRYRL